MRIHIAVIIRPSTYSYAVKDIEPPIVPGVADNIVARKQISQRFART
jgi:hypothetical protein